MSDLLDYFVPMGTTSPDHTCWTLQIDDEIFGSIVTSSSATKSEAWLAFQAKERWEASFWAAVEGGDVEALRGLVRQ